MKFPVVCFDLDGTLIDETIFIWQTIHEALGVEHESTKKMAELFFAKKITYDEWARSDINFWKEKGATKERLLRAISPLKLMPGAIDTITALKDAGVKIAIVSGSLNIALEHVLPDYKDYFDYIFLNHIYFNEDGTIKDIVSTRFDQEHKATALKEIAKKENLSPKQIAFIGDNHNDIHIAEEAGFSIAFNCKSDSLAQIADIVITEKDLRKVLEHLI
jgi:HAD superfamily PSPase-like hydrolase